MQEDNRNYRLVALLLTLLITGGALWLLMSCRLHYHGLSEQNLLTQLKQDSIIFGGEYVMLGDTPDPAESQDVEESTPDDIVEEVKPDVTPDVEGDDLDDAGPVAPKPQPKVTQKEPSPMRVKEQPKEEKPVKTGARRDNAKPTETPKVSRTPGNATNDRAKNAFGQAKGTGTGKQGSTNGNSATGAVSGKPGISGLVGYTLEYWGRPHSKWTGKVRVQVHVNTRGKVTQARAVDGSGEAWAHPEVRRSCEQESLKSAFSVPKNTTTEGIGYITWRFV